MFRYSLACFAFILSALGQSALAADPNCKNPVDQASMNLCADKALKASDKQLNDKYHALYQGSSAAGKLKLQTAQRAWIAYRDAQCTFNTMGSVGGSMHPLAYSTCADMLTQAQTKVLDQQLNCDDGDTSCGRQ
jgi:uncharacterized protein YecT (DUF1311 family)